jgi:hypothetical protein
MNENTSRAEVVWLWLDHAKFGCGRRQFAATRGRKWVHLILIGTGEHATISIADFERGKVTTQPINTDKARRRLRRNAKEFGNETNFVKDALDALRVQA